MDMLINLDMVGRPSLDCNLVIIEQDEGNSVQENDRTSCHIGEITRKMVSQYTNLRATVRFTTVIICLLKRWVIPLSEYTMMDKKV
jgi:hypothetical protein